MGGSQLWRLNKALYLLVQKKGFDPFFDPFFWPDYGYWWKTGLEVRSETYLCDLVYTSVRLYIFEEELLQESL